MSKEKTLGELRTERLFKRLKETEEGSALARVIEAAGSRAALARALGLSITYIDNWCARGMVSQGGAEKIADSDYFNVTREQMRPDLKKFQWKEEA